MARRTAPARALPQGVVLCGWCDSHAAATAIARDALTAIADTSHCHCGRARLTSYGHYPTCPTGIAQRALNQITIPTVVSEQTSLLEDA